MPTHEYRIIVDGKIINKVYTKSRHETFVSIFKDSGQPFITEVIPLV